MKKVAPFILAFLFALILISAWKFPAWTPVFGIPFLVLSLALAVYAIFERHRGAEAARVKISRDALILILTILLVAFLGGLAGLFTNQYVSLKFESRLGSTTSATMGFVSALAAGFMVGYLVKKGIGKLVG